MKHLGSLRIQLTLAATVLVAVVIALAGVTVAIRSYDHDRTQLDARLADRATKTVEDLAKEGGALDGNKGRLERNASGNELLAGSESLARILEGDTVVDERGDIPTGRVPLPHGVGFSVVEIDGQDWRSLVRAVSTRSNLRFQVLESVAAIDERFEDNTRLIAMVTALAVLVTAIGTWIAAGLLLRPLERLRVAALKIQPGNRADQRLPKLDHPREVADLTSTLNSTLDRLESSAEATRRFTADAGHELRTPLAALGMDLETLSRHPELPETQRVQMLAAMTDEHERVSRLLAGLLALARGDSEALPSRSILDVEQLVGDAVHAARIRHPHVAFDLDADAHSDVEGWAEGLRLAIDNLLDNAARHGRPDGHIAVTVAKISEQHVEIAVDDDGPGIAPAERDLVVQRFTRGNTTGSGSGLGLAMVEQQARLHGGTLALGDAAAGGLRAGITLPVVTRK